MSQELINAINDLSQKHQVRLIFSHSRGGGADFFLQEHLLDNSLTILVRNISSLSTENIEIINNKKIIAKYTFTDIGVLLETLSKINVIRLDINHVIDLDNLENSLGYITKYIIDNKLQAAFYLHDYFSLCPTVNLINNNSVYCGLPTDENICNNCLSTNKLFLNYPLPDGALIKKLRVPFLALLKYCSKIFVFSASSKKLLLKCYPELVAHVHFFHIEKDHMPKIINKVDFSGKTILNIGILGMIWPLKGLWKLQELSWFIKILDLPIRLTVIGIAGEEINNAQINGAYLKEDLAKIVASYDIDLFVMPSICPETYCYTADEIMQMGYPIICFDIGAPPERVMKYEHGYIAKDINSYSLLEKLIEVAAVYKFKYFEAMDNMLLIDKLIDFINRTSRQQVRILQAKNEEMKIKSRELELKSCELEAKLEELRVTYNSNSWKITAPLRKIMGLFRK